MNSDDIMMKVFREVESEVKKWFEDTDYTNVHIIVLEEIFIFLDGKLRDEDVAKFNEDFNCDLIYKMVYGSDLKKRGVLRPAHRYYDELDHDFYMFSHPCIEEFTGSIKNWLISHDLNCTFNVLCYHVELILFWGLSENQIREFEEEFELELKKSEFISKFGAMYYCFN